jgi:hypothetical protein
MADPIVDQDPVRGNESITSWYDCSRPMWIDLIGDYAGKELFLVEGDSLLRECFEDDRIDFDGNPSPPRCTIQPLHQALVQEGYMVLCLTDLIQSKISTYWDDCLVLWC